MKDYSAKLLAKSERTIATAELLLRAGDAEGSAGRAYYAMFYVAEALLFEEGQQFGKHAAVQAAFGQRFAKPGRVDAKYHQWLIAAFARRLLADYSVDEQVTAPEVATMIDQAREFLTVGRELLKS